uniref:Venom gland peptide U8-PHTX-Pmx1b n=1 Tax=Periegops suteri TaxID=440353 RepID=A0A6B9KLQ3_9ARAC|nr:venom gland peptide U8-PHTX-Pmx1b [Periegops suteri]
MKHILLFVLVIVFVVAVNAEKNARENEVEVPFVKERKCAGWSEDCARNVLAEATPCCDSCVICQCNAIGQSCTCSRTRLSCSTK